ncbi:hypothetical protein BH23GEM9_BH23GEM9_16600 [soil metagenome]
MGLPLLFIMIFAAAVAFGVWRRFTSIQWIWLLFGTCVAMLVIWFLLVVFVIGPQMQRMIRFSN